MIIDKRKAMAVAPILRLGFRPFFLLGAVLAALAIPVWIAALQGWALPAPVGGWLADQLGGARVTFWNFVVLAAAVVGVLFFLAKTTGRRWGTAL